MSDANKGNWYPSAHQLKDPVSTERTIRRVLDIVYELHGKVNGPAAPAKGTAGLEPGGPANTMLGGIPLEPFDVNTLNDGDTLQYDKAQRRFVVKT